jgi:hypothetical protein
MVKGISSEVLDYAVFYRVPPFLLLWFKYSQHPVLKHSQSVCSSLKIKVYCVLKMEDQGLMSEFSDTSYRLNVKGV